MNTYIVSYTEIFPGANEYSEEELTKTAFVLATSWDGAASKVTKRFKKESESVNIKAIVLDNRATIII